VFIIRRQLNEHQQRYGGMFSQREQLLSFYMCALDSRTWQPSLEFSLTKTARSSMSCGETWPSLLPKFQHKHQYHKKKTRENHSWGSLTKGDADDGNQ
jgi:hypothetical protein